VKLRLITLEVNYARITGLLTGCYSAICDLLCTNLMSVNSDFGRKFCLAEVRCPLGGATSAEASVRDRKYWHVSVSACVDPPPPPSLLSPCVVAPKLWMTTVYGSQREGDRLPALCISVAHCSAKHALLWLRNTHEFQEKIP